jgi:hypothetical protein
MHVVDGAPLGASATGAPHQASTCSMPTCPASSPPAPAWPRRAAVLRQRMVDKRAEHHDYVRRTGQDLAEVTGWTWNRSP